MTSSQMMIRCGTSTVQTMFLKYDELIMHNSSTLLYFIASSEMFRNLPQKPILIPMYSFIYTFNVQFHIYILLNKFNFFTSGRVTWRW